MYIGTETIELGHLYISTLNKKMILHECALGDAHNVIQSFF